MGGFAGRPAEPGAVRAPRLPALPLRRGSGGKEVGDSFLRFEFLIRSREKMRCTCIDYATRQQRDFILAYADRLVEELALRT